jgi:hypothetical protein
VLKGNNDNVSGMRWLSGTYAAIRDTTEDTNKIMNNGLAFGMKVGKPYGYNGLNGYLLPQQPGGFIRATLSGSADLSATISSIANLIATIQGESTISLGINAAYNMYCTIIGEGNLTPDLKAMAWMWANLDAGARPSAFDIVQEILNAQASQYNNTGTIGQKINSAASGGVDYNALAEAVWDSEVSGRTSGQAGKTLEDIKKKANMIPGLY